MPALTTDTPLGPITLVEEDAAITRLLWGGAETDQTQLLTEAIRQLTAYFNGELTQFDLPLTPKVTPSQGRFLDALIAIPYGETRTYGELAKDLAISPQAAGQACGANPIAIKIRRQKTNHPGVQNARLAAWRL